MFYPEGTLQLILYSSRVKISPRLPTRILSRNRSRQTTNGSYGRLVDEKKSIAFEELCVFFLESNDICQYSLVAWTCWPWRHFLWEEKDTPYKQLTSKLSRHYGDNIAVKSIRGKSSIVTFKERWWVWWTESNIWHGSINTRDDIRLIHYNCDQYSTPSFVEKLDEFVPDSLKCFLNGVLK